MLRVPLGGYAAGVFGGSPPRLISSKTGSRLVHGRSAAGGWSQHRFARRRENQAALALAAAADTAVAVLCPYLERLDAVVLGGDRRTAAGLRSDPRLRPVLDRAVERFLTVPDPKLTVLQDTPRLFRAIRITLTEPPGPAPDADVFRVPVGTRAEVEPRAQNVIEFARPGGAVMNGLAELHAVAGPAAIVDGEHHVTSAGQILVQGICIIVISHVMPAQKHLTARAAVEEHHRRMPPLRIIRGKKQLAVKGQSIGGGKNHLLRHDELLGREIRGN